MYVAKNIYASDILFVGMPDDKFLHETIELAKKRYALDKDITLDNELADKLKYQQTPVMFCSTVDKFDKTKDLVVNKKELFSRLKQRFIVIDADFEAGQEAQSNMLRANCIKLAMTHNSKLIIYPSASYPAKPRFRAIFFVKRVMNNSSYFKAVTWLFEQLNYTATDRNDYRIRNTNLPYFTDTEQIDNVFDNTLDPTMGKLDNKLWSGYDAAPAKKDYVFDTGPLDRLHFDEDTALQLADKFIQSGLADEYSTVWPFVNSLARAHALDQISDSSARKVLVKIADVASEVHIAERWAHSNVSMFNAAKLAIESDQSKMLAARPLIKYFS